MSAFAFLDPRLLLVLPISLVKYPLAFLVRDPLSTSIVLTLFAALFYVDDSNAMQETITINDKYPISNWIWSLSFAGLETAVFARLLLKPLLAARNEILAKSILDQCKLYTNNGEQKPETTGWFDNFLTKENTSPMSTTCDTATDVIYAPGSPAATVSDQGEKVVVAVLGMAHCNGIMKLLKERRV